MRYTTTIGLLIVVGLTASCATVTRGTRDNLQVNSQPPGATVTTSIGEGCDETPCAFKATRKGNFDVTVAREGCQPVTVRVVPELAGGGGVAMVGNVLAGGVIGVGIDAASGATNNLVPNPVDVTLQCTGA